MRDQTTPSRGRHALDRSARRSRSFPLRPGLLAAAAAVVATGVPVGVLTAIHESSGAEPVTLAAASQAPTLAPAASPGAVASSPSAVASSASPLGSGARIVRSTPLSRSSDRMMMASASASASDEPIPGLSDAPCPDTSVEKGLKPQTIRLYRAVCHAFPQVTDYLGWGPRSEHDTGNAIDVMVYGDKALGDAIAAWAQQHAAQLDLYDVLWYQRIWTPVRASEGWRKLPDRGSPTANHMNHVHLGTN